MDDFPSYDRRRLLCGVAAGAIVGLLGCSAAVAGVVTNITNYGARRESPDNTRAIQAAIDDVHRRGGGTIVVPGRFRCGNIVVRGSNVVLQGEGDAWLIDARLTVAGSASALEVRNLGFLHTRGDPESYLLDISGRNCRFIGVSLVKQPIAGGYQMYLRQSSASCHFDGLRLKGSNGVMVAGRDHLFERFELESTMSRTIGGDDAFAIKGLDAVTSNITIRNGIVRGFSAIVSFGSEVGTSGRPSNFEGAIRNVLVQDVVGDRCASIAFFKPGALIYDWRNGLVEDVRLERLTLEDPTGERFTSGIRMIAARGAVIRKVVGQGLQVRARASSQGVMPTAGVDLTLLNEGAAARIEDIDLQIAFADPHGGAAHGPNLPGYPVDHIVRVEKSNPVKGSMRGISLDVVATGSRFGGVYIGAGLDDAVTLRRAHLTRVGMDPPATAGGGGIWSDSRLSLGDVSVDSPVLPRFGGKASGRN